MIILDILTVVLPLSTSIFISLPLPNYSLLFFPVPHQITCILLFLCEAGNGPFFYIPGLSSYCRLCTNIWRFGARSSYSGFHSLGVSSAPYRCCSCNRPHEAPDLKYFFFWTFRGTSSSSLPSIYYFNC